MTNYARTVSLMSVVIIIGFLLLIDKRKVLPRHFKSESTTSPPEEPTPSEERISWTTVDDAEDTLGSSWEATINSSEPQPLPGSRLNHSSQWNLSTGSRSAAFQENSEKGTQKAEDDEQYEKNGKSATINSFNRKEEKKEASLSAVPLIAETATYTSTTEPKTTSSASSTISSTSSSLTTSPSPSSPPQSAEDEGITRIPPIFPEQREEDEIIAAPSVVLPIPSRRGDKETIHGTTRSSPTRSNTRNPSQLHSSSFPTSITITTNRQKSRPRADAPDTNNEPADDNHPLSPVFRRRPSHNRDQVQESFLQRRKQKKKELMDRVTRFFLSNSPMLIDMLQQIQEDFIDT